MIKTNSNDKVLTTRRFLAGQALSGIIARSPSWSNKKDVVREAYEWADKMLEEGQSTKVIPFWIIDLSNLDLLSSI